MPNFCFQAYTSLTERRSARLGKGLHLGEALFTLANPRLYSYQFPSPRQRVDPPKRTPPLERSTSSLRRTNLPNKLCFLVFVKPVLISFPIKPK